MSSEPALECRGLDCGYPGRKVLSGVDLTFRSGRITALLGPNGSGKSTLLRTITKTLPALTGKTFIRGRDAAEMTFRELAQQVAFVPQEEHAAFGFTVRQIVVMGRLPLSGGLLDTKEDHVEAAKAMAAADCLQLQDRIVTELSGGEKQRVLIARALAQGAKILLMDEPTSHLDVGHQVAIAKLLRDLSEQGYTTIVAVHDLNLAGTIADDGILLANGRIGLHAPIRKVLEDPLADSVYGVAFRRIQAGDEGLYIFPQMS